MSGKAQIDALDKHGLDKFVQSLKNYFAHADGTKATGTWDISITGSAASAGEFTAAKSITLTGVVTGTASSKGGWSITTTIGNGQVTNAMLANSKVTIAGTEVSLGGSITAATIGNALTSAAPAAYATFAAKAGALYDPAIGNATTPNYFDSNGAPQLCTPYAQAHVSMADKDGSGNTITSTYYKQTGGLISGDVTIGTTAAPYNLAVNGNIQATGGVSAMGIVDLALGSVAGMGTVRTITLASSSQVLQADEDGNITIPLATTGANGLLSAADKTKLNSLTNVPRCFIETYHTTSTTIVVNHGLNTTNVVVDIYADHSSYYGQMTAVARARMSTAPSTYYQVTDANTVTITLQDAPVSGMTIKVKVMTV